MNTSMMKKMWMMAGVLLICVTLIGIKGCLFKEDKGIASIERGEYGEVQKTKRLQVSIGDEEMRTVEIQVSSKKYTKKQLREKFAEAVEVLETIILGENKSENQITKDMYLPANLSEYPFKITWELSRYDVMDNKGQILVDKLEEVDPKREGVQVTITGILSYEEEEAVYRRDVLLFAPKRQQNIYDQLIQQVTLEDEASREEEKLTLPMQVQGKPVTWQSVPDYTIEQLIILGILGVILSVFWEKDQEKKRKKAKKEQMLLDYPEIIGQLTMLMEAGMTSKATWKKITDDYKVQRSRTGKSRAAYEEMLYTWQEMQSGIPESDCYERFADRCELSPYMKMGALLSQNIRKGTKGLSEMLSMEALEAMEERRNRAKRLGEEAGTKLMIPMVMMLIVVMIIVVVPAFMSIQM